MKLYFLKIVALNGLNNIKLIKKRRVNQWNKRKDNKKRIANIRTKNEILVGFGKINDFEKFKKSQGNSKLPITKKCWTLIFCQ